MCAIGGLQRAVDATRRAFIDRCVAFMPSRRVLACGALVGLCVNATSVSAPTTSQAPASSTQREHRALPSAEELAKLPPDGRPDYNRLVFEKSPYLLQHATNPVDWFPWCDAAFEKARAESKPIFLSIGYSTCHWCHVMEHESFEDAEVAALLNKEYVAIKVDREERPDVDAIYMQVTQAITGSGGWPMTIVMTPDKRPFFAGTYFPKHGVHGTAGLMEILAYLADAWKTKHDTVVHEADKVVDAIRALAAVEGGGEIDQGLMDRAYDELAGSFDAQEGGFGDAPKFPIAHQLRFLLRYAARSNGARSSPPTAHASGNANSPKSAPENAELAPHDKSAPTPSTADDAKNRSDSSASPSSAASSTSSSAPQSSTPSPANSNAPGSRAAHALEMVERTLQAIARGGIRDHVGFGFHRYSTDREWLVPHFEKMLYDQALLSTAYVEAYELTRKNEYRDVARQTLDYVLRDMTSPDGGFYSAEDADSAGQEGLFYTWTPSELGAVLGDADAKLFGDTFGVPIDASASMIEGAPRHVLHLVASWPELAAKHGMSEPDFRARIEPLRKKLFDAREKRVHPAKDEKIITGWNGLMIAALAHAGRAFDEPRYTAAARKAAEFVLARLRDANGRLAKRYARGSVGAPATADDYAYLLCGLVELYETDFDAAWIANALSLAAAFDGSFWDEEKGGYFLASKASEALIARTKDVDDGALPSSNSIAALALIELARITADHAFELRADAIFKAFAKTIAKRPSAYAQMMIALDFASASSLEIVIVSHGAGSPRGPGTPRDSDGSGASAMLAALRSRFLPNAIVVARSLDRESASATPAVHRAPFDIVQFAPYVESMSCLDDKPTAYVCRGFACGAPTNDVETMMKSVQVASLPPRPIPPTAPHVLAPTSPSPPKKP
jgi:uncharacterized protein YyaL (SSP411 family)